MKIILSNVIEITEPSDNVLKYCKEKLTFINPEYGKRKKMGYWVGKIPKDIKLYCICNNKLYVPYGFFEELWKVHPYKEDYVDYTTTKHADIKSNIVLRDYQEPCVRAFKEHYTGILSIPVGTGKTESILHTISELKQKTLFMAHTIDLVNQAKERSESKMSCKTSLITDGKIDISGDIVFGTIQSVYKFIENGALKQDDFGMIVMDECFISGTKISTPDGYKNIEDIKMGDLVYSYNHKENKVEIKKVNYLFNKNVDKIVTITSTSGEIIECSVNHPIYCNGKYIRAEHIKKGDTLYELQKMSKRNNKGKLYQSTMAEKNAILQKNRKHLLFNRMFENIFNRKSNNVYEKRKGKTIYERKQSYVSTRDKEESNGYFEKKRELETTSSWWKWNWTNKTPRNINERIRKNSGSSTRICCENTQNSNRGISFLLQNRFRDTINKIGNRIRWGISQQRISKIIRQEKGYIIREFRVEDIKIQKQGNIGEPRQSNGGIKVYNIGVEDNNNYFANNILVHNCQHISASPKSLQMFRTVFEYFSARYKAGLSAEVHRADGLQNCILSIVGNIIYGMKRDKNYYKCIYDNKEIMRIPVDKFQVPCHVIVRETEYNVDGKDVFDPNGGTIVYAKLITDMAMDEKRNNFIISDLKKMKGSTIILSDRVDQAKYLCSMIDNSVEIDGSTPKKLRKQALDDVRSGKIKYLFSSYALAKEGLDIPRLENIVLATPIKDFGVLVQSCGRIQRPFEGKTIAYVYDYVDRVALSYRYFQKRRAIYRKNNWEIDNMYLGGK